MNVICWNCRGLGNPRTVRNLYRMIREKKPNVVFLMETKLRSNKMVLMKYKMGFHNVFVVDCGKKRRLGWEQ
jgi:exonuclease III